MMRMSSPTCRTSPIVERAPRAEIGQLGQIEHAARAVAQQTRRQIEQQFVDATLVDQRAVQLAAGLDVQLVDAAPAEFAHEHRQIDLARRIGHHNHFRAPPGAAACSSSCLPPRTRSALRRPSICAPRAAFQAGCRPPRAAAGAACRPRAHSIADRRPARCRCRSAPRRRARASDGRRGAPPRR